MSGNSQLDEQAVVEALAAYYQHGYTLDADEQDDESDEPLGPDKGKLAAVLVGPISQAVATNADERERVSLTREKLMAIGFPEVPGRDAWISQPNPALAEKVYDLLDSDVWRLCDPNPSGQVQSLLNGEGALVLVRRSARKGHAADVYVTRDRQCLMTDVLVPQSLAAKRRADQAGRLSAMLMERVPEHAKKFDKELSRGLKAATSSALAITAASLAAISANGDDDGE